MDEMSKAMREAMGCLACKQKSRGAVDAVTEAAYCDACAAIVAEAAAAVEREACAKIAETTSITHPSWSREAIADAIRQRGCEVCHGTDSDCFYGTLAKCCDVRLDHTGTCKCDATDDD